MFDSRSLRIAGDLTVEFWVKTTQTGANPEWFHNPVILDKDAEGPGQPDWAVVLRNSHVVWETGNPGAGDDALEGTAVISNGVWHHVALTRNATTGEKRIYMDGVLDVVGPGATGSLANTDPLYVGIGNRVFNAFQGSLDGLRLWGVERTQDQIEAGRFVTVAENEPGLIADWRCNETGTDVLRDYSATGNFGRLGERYNIDPSDPRRVRDIPLLPPLLGPTGHFYQVVSRTILPTFLPWAPPPQSRISRTEACVPSKSATHRGH